MENKDRITEKAREMFADYGYSRVTMEELAHKLGMSKKTLYRDFKGKEAILNEILSRFRRQLEAELEAVYANEQLPFEEKLNRAAVVLATRFSSLNSRFLDDLAKNAPQASEQFTNIKKSSTIRFHALIEEGVKAGKINKKLNKSLALLLYSGLIEALLNPRLLREIPEELQQEMPFSYQAIVEGMTEIVLNGILPRK